jgi:hypothetical protein
MDSFKRNDKILRYPWGGNRTNCYDSKKKSNVASAVIKAVHFQSISTSHFREDTSNLRIVLLF